MAENPPGQFFANRKLKTSSKASYATAATTRLWQISADLAAINTDM